MIYENFGKRLFDIVFSFCGLTLLSPIFVMMALLIKIGSPGPIFFLQERMERNGKKFKLIKFRSMHICPAQEKKGFNPGDDARVTRLGKFIRKTKIDELPELINVLKGEMSIIGPRPEVLRYVKIYPDKFNKILSVRPGLSDFASIKYRDEEKILSNQSDPERFYIETILPDKLRLAQQYVDAISFQTDMKIIFETLKEVLGKQRRHAESVKCKGEE
jgi:lipopolysaccharide/colanic/teichoic acid biosynthesis glycosyltransferase